MAGYDRNDTTNNIADGNVINASDLDGEFDAIAAAFDEVTGHVHDGTANNGAPITKVGPSQEIVVSSGAVTPKTDNTVDLGSSSYEFKDLYIDGTANIDSLVADTADINGGTIDGASIGSGTPGAGAFTSLTSNSTTTLNGTTIPASKTLVVTTDIGTSVQAYDAQLADIAGLTPTDSNFIVGNGTNFVTESGATARTSLGLGSIATQAASSVSITGGSITGITDLAVADGGTGASDAGTARTNLGLGSIATQASSNVSITGGSITGITDLAVADGGTGASDAATARSNLSAAGTGVANTFTAAQTFRAASAVRSEAASTQDAVVLAGRAGGTSSYAVTLTPTTLTASRTLTLPDATTTVVGTDATQTLTNKTISTDNNTINGIAASSFVLSNASGVIDGSAAQKAIPAGVVVGTTDTQTLTNKTLTDPTIIGTIIEDVYTITDGAAFEINPGNGSIQLITLGASRTPKATSFVAGEAVTLMVDDGSAYTLTWTDATFGGSGVVWKTDGGVAPTLNTSGYTVIVLWKVSTQVYGARVGNA